jgi:hypothetical protein
MNAEVVCGDGPCGRSTCLIVKPRTETVTHVVVQEKHFPHEQFLVPLKAIARATADAIELSCDAKDLHQLDRFMVTDYVQLDARRYALGDYWLEPFLDEETELLPMDRESVPMGEVALHRGARVEATDGTVGHIDEFLVGAADGQITHLLLREGHLWAPKEVSIPVVEIDHIEADRVYLRLDKHEVESLPAVSRAQRQPAAGTERAREPGNAGRNQPSLPTPARNPYAFARLRHASFTAIRRISPCYLIDVSARVCYTHTGRRCGRESAWRRASKGGHACSVGVGRVA